MADPAPPTLSIIPIVKLDVNEDLMSTLSPPIVSISQGGAGSLYTGPKQPTPQNRKCAVRKYNGSYYEYVAENSPTEPINLRSSFGHSISFGDSGCPQYLLIDNKLYLHGMNIDGQLGDDWDYLQDVVNRAAAAQGIPPILIKTVTNPPLPL